ncbi:hypothetical protein UCREL1_6086 [Eutypa lata UCREL1]|uniref:Uncharacterized protein n=1 Tax=Eutypa lata (strain UCR-EL1) TaxID=1287681 RepID=M7TJK3_EUTLA|nr:hypothetical protein UCREL1_6086 [Eutypa lata UCREL1]
MAKTFISGHLPDTGENPAYEHVQKPAFWALLVLTIAFAFSTVGALARRLPGHWALICTRRLELRFARSRILRLATLVAYLGILGLELLEGWWVMQTIWRWCLQSFYGVVYGWAITPLFSLGLSWLCGVAMVLLGLVVVAAGCFIVVLQLLCIRELVITTILRPSTST